MGRLRGLPPRFTSPAPRVGTGTSAGPGFARSDGLSTTERGYGADWRKVRALVLRAEPMCRMCRAEGRYTPATEVDHIQRFFGREDPLRLDLGNLRPLCVPHHRARTARQAHGRE